ncbi:MAG: nucleotidyltransferase domain-containing protein [Chitinispirillales bacterium]|nr:nucleotidyltransferase domain-containing protein [Chitinispirillales bacterium]
MRRKPKYTIEEIRQKVTPIAKRHGVERVYLFGSYARGEAKAKSDLDLRIDAGKIKTYFELGGLYNDLEESLKMKVDILTTDALDEKFLNRIAKDEVLLYVERT